MILVIIVGIIFVLYVTGSGTSDDVSANQAQKSTSISGEDQWIQKNTSASIEDQWVDINKLDFDEDNSTIDYHCSKDNRVLEKNHDVFLDNEKMSYPMFMIKGSGMLIFHQLLQNNNCLSELNIYFSVHLNGFIYIGGSNSHNSVSMKISSFFREGEGDFKMVSASTIKKFSKLYPYIHESEQDLYFMVSMFLISFYMNNLFFKNNPSMQESDLSSKNSRFFERFFEEHHQRVLEKFYQMVVAENQAKHGRDNFENGSSSNQHNQSSISIDELIKAYLMVMRFNSPNGLKMTDITKRYKELVKEKHPDHGGNSEDFKMLQTAYEYLKEHFVEEKYYS